VAISPADSGDAEVDDLASLLSDELRAYDLLAVRGNHLVSMLPETSSEKAEEFVTRLRAVTWEKLGRGLDIGVSSFPAQEVTLEGLIDRAESAMRAHAEPSIVSESPST